MCACVQTGKIMFSVHTRIHSRWCTCYWRRTNSMTNSSAEEKSVFSAFDFRKEAGFGEREEIGRSFQGFGLWSWVAFSESRVGRRTPMEHSAFQAPPSACPEWIRVRGVWRLKSASSDTIRRQSFEKVRLLLKCNNDANSRSKCTRHSDFEIKIPEMFHRRSGVIKPLILTTMFLIGCPHQSHRKCHFDQFEYSHLLKSVFRIAGEKRNVIVLAV